MPSTKLPIQPKICAWPWPSYHAGGSVANPCRALIGDAAACMVGRPWPRADLRLDWQLRAGHWVLFSALARSIFRHHAALLAGALDLGRGAALGREHPRLGVAHFAAGFRGLRIDRGRDFSARCLPA